MEQTNAALLELEIVQLSKSDCFELARKEWKLSRIEKQQALDSCLCGQVIKELCYITNQINGNTVYVGNVCVNKFMQIDTGTMFNGLNRIMKDSTANPSEDLVNHALELGILKSNEARFLRSLVGRSKLSAKQQNWKKSLNLRMVHSLVVDENNRESQT